MCPEPRRVLLVSPRFPPKNAPDHHRIRLSLPYYKKFGWEPTVLCVSSESVSDSVDDPWLGASLPDDVKIERVAAWDEEKCRHFGFGQLDYRCLLPLLWAGIRLLRREKYDAIFFSTTVFLTFLLGPIWKFLFGCKVVYDFQDPWFHGGAILYTRENVPGTWWKYRVGQSLARFGEAISLRAADHIISVSDSYVSALSQRYPWLSTEKFTVLPFGAAREDFEFIRKHNIKHDIFSVNRHRVRWIYAGRVGPDMHAVLHVLFRQLAQVKVEQPDFSARLDIFFVGTNYAPADRTFKVVEPLARQHGVSDLVIEHCQRIPYFQTLSLYSESDGILLIGADTGDYTASKLFNCILSGKPVLALFHSASLVSRISSRFPSVHLSSFDSEPAEPGFQAAVACGVRWLQENRFDNSTIDREIQPWSAEALTRAQCAIFDRVAKR